MTGSFSTWTDRAKLIYICKVRCEATEYYLRTLTEAQAVACELHVQSLAPTSSIRIAHKGQTDIGKQQRDGLIGKMVEVEGVNLLREINRRYLHDSLQITEPDFKVYLSLAKSFGEDLSVTTSAGLRLPIHSKATSVETARIVTVPSWVIENADYRILAGNPDEYFMLGIVQGRRVALMGFPSCGLLGTKIELRPLDKNLATKQCIYYSDIRKLTKMERWGLLYRIGDRYRDVC